MPNDLRDIMTDYLLAPSALQLLAADPDCKLLETPNQTTAQVAEALDQIFDFYAVDGIFTRHAFRKMMEVCESPTFMEAKNVTHEWAYSRTAASDALNRTFGTHGVWTRKVFHEWFTETCKTWPWNMREDFRKLAPLIV